MVFFIHRMGNFCSYFKTHPSLDVPLSNFIPMLLAVENRNKSSPVIRAVANNYYNIN